MILLLSSLYLFLHQTLHLFARLTSLRGKAKQLLQVAVLQVNTTPGNIILKVIDKKIANYMMDERPTIYEALQALEVVIKYAETTFEFHQDANLLIQLGRVNEKLEKLDRQLQERDFKDICVRTGLHSMDRE